MADFDLTALPLLWIAVRWPGLAQKDEAATAEVVEHELQIQVQILDRPEFQAWMRAVEADAENPTVDGAGELAIFKTVARNWRKVKGTPDFNDENVGRLLRFPGFVPAFATAYMAAWQGRAELREGNSDGSPSGGRAGDPQPATAEGVKAPS